jgi:phage terminase large subunit-like protein
MPGGEPYHAPLFGTMPKKKEPIAPANPFVDNLPDLLSGDMEKIKAILSTFDDDTLNAATRVMLGYSAREDSPLGYKAFYELVFGKKIPEHAYYEWVIPLYFVSGKITWEQAQKEYEGKDYDWLLEEMQKWVDVKPVGIVIEAFRGSTKSTTITVGMTAFNIAHNPLGAALFLQAGDDSAEKYSAAVAEIIAKNEGWKLAFPWIVPDEKRGWGARGYWVKDTRLSDDQWSALRGGEKDPSLLGLGYQSKEAPGKHPTWLVLDDIHDESNTSSPRELANVIKIVTDTVLPMMKKKTWACVVGTPWVENDSLHYLVNTKEFMHLKTPVYRDIGDVRRYTWEKEFDEEQCRIRLNLSGARGFARMYLMDLTLIERAVFKYHLYPNSEIRYNWVMAGGVDYAGSADEWKNKVGKGDFFAMAYVAKLPGGGLVCVDGVLDRPTQAQAEIYLNRAQEIYPSWMASAVEGDGRGDDFIQVLRRNPRLRLIPMKTGKKSKTVRLERIMSPWIESGLVRISDANTPFLIELRKELDQWPNCEHDDALDALFWGLMNFPDQLTAVVDTNIDAKDPGRRKKANPFGSFARVLNA